MMNVKVCQLLGGIIGFCVFAPAAADSSSGRDKHKCEFRLWHEQHSKHMPHMSQQLIGEGPVNCWRLALALNNAAAQRWLTWPPRCWPLLTLVNQQWPTGHQGEGVNCLAGAAVLTDQR